MSKNFVAGVFLLVLILAILWSMESKENSFVENLIDTKESKKTEELTNVNLYFVRIIDRKEEIIEVEREISITNNVIEDSLRELLKGPLPEEKELGFSTSINEGTFLQEITIRNDVAFVDFNSRLEENVAGSAWVMAIRSQIEKTLTQFEVIKDIVISIDGRTEDILQP